MINFPVSNCQWSYSITNSKRFTCSGTRRQTNEDLQSPIKELVGWMHDFRIWYDVVVDMALLNCKKKWNNKKDFYSFSRSQIDFVIRLLERTNFDCDTLIYTNHFSIFFSYDLIKHNKQQKQNTHIFERRGHKFMEDKYILWLNKYMFCQK